METNFHGYIKKSKLQKGQNKSELEIKNNFDVNIHFQLTNNLGEKSIMRWIKKTFYKRLKKYAKYLMRLEYLQNLFFHSQMYKQCNFFAS